MAIKVIEIIVKVVVLVDKNRIEEESADSKANYCYKPIVYQWTSE